MLTLTAARGGTVLVGLLMVGALTGCTTSPEPLPTLSAEPTGSPSPSDSPVASPSSASPSPSSEEPVASGWTVSPAGIGPLVLGEPLSGGAGLPESYVQSPAELCPNPNMRIFQSPDHPTLWVQVDEPETVVAVSMGGDPPASAQEAGTAATAEGIGLGASEAEVVSAYPAAVVDATELYTFYSVLDPAGARVEFDVRDSRVGMISVQNTPEHATEFCG